MRRVCLLMSDGHWRNLTARKMPWRTPAGEMQLAADGMMRPFGADPLSALPPKRWAVPGPLGVVIRFGSAEYQAWRADGPWIVLAASDGTVTRMYRADYEVLVGVRERPQPKPCLVSVQVEGQPVPLDRCQWVLWMPCGCPEGVHSAATGSHVHAADEDAAWACLFDSKRERGNARKGGWRVELMTHERYVREVSPQMRGRCPHEAEQKASA